MKSLKTLFITGLVILLPLALTLAIVVFVVNFLTKPFLILFSSAIEKLPGFEAYPALIHLGLQILIIFFLFAFIVLLGFLAKLLLFKSLLRLNDFLIHRIPFIKTIYKASQQVIKSILGNSSRSFKQVVMVPFPHKGIYSIGLVSGNAPQTCQDILETQHITVFVPTTPNPTSGFLMLFKKEEVIFTDMKVEDALKYIISCGVISSSTEEN